MLTELQRKLFVSELKKFKRKYLKEKYFEMHESDTRLMINSFLVDVLGYAELDEIKTEQAIKGTYADYVIQIDKTRHFIIEVKAIQLKLSEKHIRQALHYASDEGIDWVLLTNGREWLLFRVLFEKPIRSQLVFSIDLSDAIDFKKAPKFFEYLTRKCVARGDLESYWKRFVNIEPNNFCKFLYEPDVIRLLKNKLKKKSGINFTEEDLFDAIHKTIITKITIDKPKFKK